VHEVQRGERSVEESESRLKLFVERVTQRGLRDSRKLKAKSRDALETFLKLNVFILHIKKVCCYVFFLVLLSIILSSFNTQTPRQGVKSSKSTRSAPPSLNPMP